MSIDGVLYGINSVAAEIIGSYSCGMIYCCLACFGFNDLR